MASLVSRFASNIYWLGRYLERAENLARILDINETYAREDAAAPNWERVLKLYSDKERFEDLYGPPTGNAVLFFYLFDRDNFSSIASCIYAARENARSVRHLISTEMWTQINMLHGTVRELHSDDPRQSEVSSISRQLIAGCQTFEGVAEGTFLRGEPWCFYQLGKFLERADQTTRILDIGYDRLTASDDDVVAWVHWNVLLRSVSGYHGYRALHPGASSPNDIATYLLYDEQFPRAVALCGNLLTKRLRDIEKIHGRRPATKLETNRRQLEFLIETGPGKDLTSASLHRYLDRIQVALGEVSNSIGDSYFIGR